MNDSETANKKSLGKRLKLNDIQLKCSRYTHGCKGMETMDKTGSKFRGHNWALTKEHRKLDIKKHAFFHKLCWNRFSVECLKINAIRENKV